MRGTIGIFSAAVVFSFASTAGAQAVNDSSVRGQLNQCWGQVASQIAKLEDNSVKGGGMGAHSRSTQAANTVGGFASDDNAFGITFNTDGGRQGVGNVSKGQPHNAHPGDGGNGQHAINNSSDTVNGIGFTTLLDPVTGQATAALGGTAPDRELDCDLVP